MNIKGTLFNLSDDEKVEKVLRRHWISFLKPIVVTFVFFVIFFIIYTIVKSDIKPFYELNGVAINLITKNMGRGLLIVVGTMFLLSLCGYFYISWLDYYLDIFLLTNRRIVRLEQIILFGSKSSETNFLNVQDVSSKINGFVGAILNIGYVFIETAGERENFAFGPVKDPASVAAKVLELQVSLRDSEREKDTDMGAEKCKDRVIDEVIEPCPPVQECKPVEKISVEEPPKEIPVFESSATKPAQNKHYTDGRVITPEGVIWQSNQEITQEIIDTLNAMDENKL